jgi:L-lactate utilization protein LutC
MSRDHILHKTRTALGRSAGQAPAEAPPVRLIVPPRNVEERIGELLEAAAKLGARTLRASSPKEALRYVSELVDGKRAVASDAAVLEEYGIAALAGVCHGLRDLASLKSACASADLGITSCDYALADTGTLVMIASPQEARMVSLLPPAHVAIVPKEKILAGLDELFTLLPLPSDAASSMVLITGPSRTADIEQILVRGVHGPGEVHIVVV